MKKKIKQINWNKALQITLFVSLIFVITFCLFNPNVLADVGNNNRYDSDSGDSSSSSGWVGFIVYVLFDLFGPLPGIIIILGMIILFFVLKKKGKLGSVKEKINEVQRGIDNTVNGLTGSLSNVDNTVEVDEKVRQIDPSFSKDAFISWTREVFIKIQQAWSSRNWKVIRPFESNELFSQHSTQLQEYIDNNKINMIEKIAVQYCSLREFKQDGDKEVIIVELHAVMRDYVIDATTKQVLEGDPNKDWNMKYLMTFNRKVGVKTNPGTSNKSTTNCPNCGAPTEITSAGQCSYCSSVITTGEHDWVLSNITSIN
ncbi:MAG: Tim44-like domain-containing protein [Bacilli bacterium]